MEKINHVIEIANQTHHMPLFFSMLVGLFVARKKLQLLYEDYSDVPGDNIPATLIEGMER